jgi:predicted ATPase/DNA-binding SARP family transcriptional activator
VATRQRPEHPELAVRLLGGFQVEVRGRAVPDDAWRLRRAKTLIKLLALTPERRMHREQIAEALWPEGEGSAAGLHQVLYVARKAIATASAETAGSISMREDVVELDGAAVWVDAEAFESAGATARDAGELGLYRAALDLYGGELLPEDRYEQWAAARRESLREMYLALLVEQSALLAATGDQQAAVEVLMRAVAEDPLHEGAQRELMRLFTDSGRRQQALAQYQQLRQALSEQLAADPDPETAALYREILASQQPGEDTATTALTREEDSPAPGPPEAAGTSDRARAALQHAPRQLTSFVGRLSELAELERLMARARLLTLTGPGGAGKTRLAYELIARREGDFADGVHVVELAPIGDPALVVEETAAAFGMQLRAAREPLEALQAQIGERSVLLVLDNCEHLIGACATLADRLLRACPNLRVLATSRERLRTDGEVAWRVPPLSLPEAVPGVRAASLEPFEAVRLFCERAADVSPGFALTDENAESVAEICRGLDGMPLALELAAARVSMLTPAQIAERLSDALALLGSGSRSGLTRQQTLRATLQWSHDLLTEPERALYRCLGVFAGSFGIDAVEHVAAAVARPESDDVVELLGALVDKSLVQVEAGPGANRYRLLETVRLDARERLDAARELSAVEDAHRRWYAGLAQAADRDLDPGVDAQWPVDLLEAELDNFRTALSSGLRSAPDDALRLACALWWFWMIRGYFSEGLRWLGESVGAASEPTPERARGLFGLGALCVRSQGDLARTVRYGREALEIASAGGDPAARARALERLGMMGMGGFDWETADQALAEGLELALEVEDDAIIAAVQQSQGVLAGCRGETETARELFTRGLDLLARIPAERGPVFWAARISPVTLPAGPNGAPRHFFEDTFCLFRSVGSEAGAAYMLCNIAETWRAEGDFPRAREGLELARERFAGLGDEIGEAGALNALGNLARLTGEFAAGQAHFERALEIRRAARDPRETATTLTGMGMLALAAGEREPGLDLFDQARAIYERTEDAPGLEALPLNLAAFELDGGEPERACRLFEQSAILSQKRSGLQRIGSWSLAELAEAAIALGDISRAREALVVASDDFRRFRDVRGLSYARSLEARIAEEGR